MIPTHLFLKFVDLKVYSVRFIYYVLNIYSIMLMGPRLQKAVGFYFCSDLSNLRSQKYNRNFIRRFNSFIHKKYGSDGKFFIVNINPLPFVQNKFIKSEFLNTCSASSIYLIFVLLELKGLILNVFNRGGYLVSPAHRFGYTRFCNQFHAHEQKSVADLLNTKIGNICVADHVAADFSLVLKISKFSDNYLINKLFLVVYATYLEVLDDALSFMKASAGRDPYIVQNSQYSINLYLHDYTRASWGLSKHFYVTPVSGVADAGRFSICSNFQAEKIYKNQSLSKLDHRIFLAPAIEFAKKFIQHNIINGSVFSYSPLPSNDENFYQKVNLEVGSKYLCYFTSSPDEELAGDLFVDRVPEGLLDEMAPYDNELSAVSDLCDTCSEKGVHLVIRMHPRLAPDARVNRFSDTYRTFLNDLYALVRNRPNIQIIKPEDNVSSYQLAISAHKCFTYRSSMGAILPIMGISTCLMTNNRNLIYPYYDQITLKSAINEAQLDPVYLDDEQLSKIIVGFFLTNFGVTFDGFDDVNENVDDLFSASVQSNSSYLAFLNYIRPSKDVSEVVDVACLLGDYRSWLDKQFTQFGASWRISS